MEIENIKQVLKQKKMTYEDLASKTNLSISTIKKILSGTAKYPRVDTMITIEKALGIYQEPGNSLSSKEKEILDLLLQLDENQLNDALSVIKILAKK